VSELAKVLLHVKQHEHFQELIFRKINSLTNSERSAEQRDARSRRINAKRFAWFGAAQTNRFALIPLLRALAGAPVGMTEGSVA